MSSTPETPDQPNDLDGLDFKFIIDPDYLEQAATNKQIFDAHVSVGFTEQQALELVVQVIASFSEMTSARMVLQAGMGEDDGAA